MRGGYDAKASADEWIRIIKVANGCASGPESCLSSASCGTHEGCSLPVYRSSVI